MGLHTHLLLSREIPLAEAPRVLAAVVEEDHEGDYSEDGGEDVPLHVDVGHFDLEVVQAGLEGPTCAFEEVDCINFHYEDLILIVTLTNLFRNTFVPGLLYLRFIRIFMVNIILIHNFNG